MAIQHGASVGLGVAFAATIIAYPALPAEMPLLVAFALPIAATAIWWLLAHLGARSASMPGRSGSAGAITALFLSAFHVTMLIGFVGAHFWLGRFLGLMVGLFLIITGNDLPRLRPNLVWGIRTPHTLGSDEVWKRVHRLGGYIRVVMGIVVCVASLAGMPGFAELIPSAVFLETLVCVCAGVFFSRQRGTIAFPAHHGL
jgi:uncharacterized membrane protein